MLAILFDCLLFLLPLEQSWRYRLAFLVGASIAWLVFAWFLPVIFLGGNLDSINLVRSFAGVAGRLLIALIGAFIGSLVATARRETLWENNAPPPAAILTEVLQIHRQVIGEPPQGAWSKRAFDVILSLSGLLVSIPIWIISLFLVWIEDPGPVLFVKNSVGRGGANFHQFKIRSMVHGAEQETGPVLAQETDARVLWIGRLLRKTALDELPQLVNILMGDMSFVGPRPQRTVLVYEYLLKMPEYAQRHRLRPGLAGLAQVAGDYYLTPRQKLRFDRIYIQHQSLGYDLKLLLSAFSLAFWYRWQRGWNGRLPRWLLHSH